MSSILDAQTGDPYYTGSYTDYVGPQTDGTNWPSPISTIPQPTDTAGGQPANYAQSVLDIFKYGVGAYTQTANTSALLDYKRFEATNGGLYQQGRGAVMPKAQQGGGGSNLAMIGIAALVVFAVMTHKA